MGAFDNLGRLCESQAISADDTASEDTIDLVDVASQVGVGTPVYLNIRTAVAPTDTADTLSIEVQVDSAVAFASPKIVLMPLVGANGAEIAGTDARLLTAGAWIYRGALPFETNERHLRLMFRNTTSNGTFTIDAWLSATPPDSDRGVEILTSPVGNP
ncbi:MAG TPA: hypothetical protein DG761_11375 [Gammaproteobacteria bacterium]|jgi:hypothetical protein|nr:hypothetical protein [Gammaproteobacteria bacterium]|tara:strand:+ start:330 stop:803 length:474 start_codon:yes stop_codon:yes gene_type:complete